VSLYRQSGAAILNLNIWSASALSKEDIAKFESFFEKIRLYPDEISAQPVYRWTYEFQSANGLYAGLVPLQWARQQSSTDISQVDRFISPDLRAVVQITRYDDGKRISISDASFIVLFLLREEYGQDLIITEEQPQPEGRELLIWKTSEGDINGATFFEVKETTLTIITSKYPVEENIYQTLLKMISESVHTIE
jgi:hypothetical protein